ncbi:MAG: hypothetical protein BJ554DRAFT_2969 [Olpidium bornovanus]|uniref:Uncharacterized protein n=1 Tax=Olpidium bornovanus TaxID=278681 RepID=A0A8H8A0H3_9FUNG|nr:MAG: hypothetical protein BJ554DRAFT_2969 [Olpidium bornovanus]
MSAAGKSASTDSDGGARGTAGHQIAPSKSAAVAEKCCPDCRTHDLRYTLGPGYRSRNPYAFRPRPSIGPYWK